MSRLDELKKEGQRLKEELHMHIGDENYHYAKTTINNLIENDKKIVDEVALCESIPLCDELSFEELETGTVFREESSTTNIDGIYYYHTVLFITPNPDSSGVRTAFTKVRYLEEFWYSTVDEDYFK